MCRTVGRAVITGTTAMKNGTALSYTPTFLVGKVGRHADRLNAQKRSPLPSLATYQCVIVRATSLYSPLSTSSSMPSASSNGGLSPASRILLSWEPPKSDGIIPHCNSPKRHREKFTGKQAEGNGPRNNYAYPPST